MPDSSGANPAARCAPAATAIAANQENVASPPPTAISNIVRVRKCARILVSPATAAATALAGRIADVRQVFAGQA
jgi:homoaconitase/3-isopropylmalate dehydratase large subunit